MTRLEELKREQQFYKKLSKEQLGDILKEIENVKRTHPRSSFTVQYINELEYGTRDLSKEIEREERNINAVNYNRKILYDYMEKTGKSLLEAINDTRYLFKKVE